MPRPQPIHLVVTLALVLTLFSPFVARAATPVDPRYSEQWGLTKIAAPAAWDVTTGSPNVVIAVVDSGVDITHPDLAGQIWTNPGEIAGNAKDDDGNGYVDDIHGWNVLANNADLSDSTGHGTQVAGVIAAKANNGAGGAGVCWGCKLMVVKVTQQSGAANYSDIAAGVRYAAQKGAQVINVSLGGTSDSAALRAAVAEAAPNAVIVAGAGNSGGEAPFYPAAYNEYVLAVAGSAENDTRVTSSNYGAWVDVSAPGQNVLTTFSGGGYGLTSGTSVGAPFASGLAGLLLSAHPDWSPAQVRAQIIRTADSIDALNPGYAGKLGGRIDAGAALSVAARPDLRIGEVRVNGALDGRPEPGAAVELQVLLHNTWAGASDVRAMLSGGAPATISRASASFGAVPSLSTTGGDVALRFTVPNSAGYSKALAFTLRVTAAGGYSANLPLTITTAPGITTAPATISGNMTWTSDRLYLVNGNTGITAGSTLTIQPGTTVRFAPNANLLVQGTLIANGTAEQKIIFTGTSGAASWGQIRLENAVPATFDKQGNYLSGSLLRHSVIEGGRGVHLASGYVADSLFRNLLSDTSYPHTGGLTGAISGHLIVERNRFEGASINLYEVYESTITIRNNQVENGYINAGAKREYDPMDTWTRVLLIEGNSVQSAPTANTSLERPYAIAATGQGTVSKNMVFGGPDGIVVGNNDDALLVTNNHVSEVAGRGVAVFGSAIEVRDNTVLRAGEAGVFVGAALRVRGNNLLPLNGAYALRIAQTGGAIDATGNWWGSADPAVIAGIVFDGADEFGLGTINSGSALSTPSATAPAYVERVTVSPDDTLGIQPGTFDLRFSRPMDVSTAPSVTFTDTRNGTAQRFDYPTISGTTVPAVDSQGMLWSASAEALLRFDGQRWTVQPFPAGLLRSRIYGLAIDASDRIWLAGNRGLVLFDRQQFTAYPMCGAGSAEGCLDYEFRNIAIATDGTAWLTSPVLGGGAAVARFKDGNWTVYTSANGLPSNIAIDSLYVQPNGDVWITLLSSSDIWSPNIARLSGTTWTFSTARPAAAPKRLNAFGLAADADGSLWTRVGNSLLHFDGQAWHEMATNPFLTFFSSSPIVIDEHGVKWFYAPISGTHYLLRFDGRSWSERTYGQTSSSFNQFIIDRDGNKVVIEFQPSEYLKLVVLYDCEELPLSQGAWIDARTYRLRHDFTAQVPRGPKEIVVREAVDADGLMIGTNVAGSFSIDYAAQISDRTAPAAPTLFPTGVTGDSSALRLSWTASDPDSAITTVRYQVGTRPGLGDLVRPTTVSVTASGQAQLAEAELQAMSGSTIQRSIPGTVAGRTYYVSLEVRNSGGLWSTSTVRPFTAGVQTLYQLYLPSLRR